MSDLRDLPGDDPRRTLRVDDGLAAADREAQPAVGRSRDGLSLWVALGVFAVLAIALFAWLTAARHRAAEPDIQDSGRAAATALPAPPLALPAQAPAVAAGPLTNVPAPQFTVNNAVPTPPPMASLTASLTPAQPGATLSAGTPSPEQRRRAPAVVVDLGGADTPVVNPALTNARPASPIPNPALPANATEAQKNASDEESFAARVGGADAERVKAVQLRNLSTLVPQGATIAATLETALDSDLPGYARAVVSRDVRAFDGKAVLIPRGSRVIGQYKAATLLGASRVFVIWTRLIRPDGVSIQLASPGADDLGRAGLTGRVDRHFFTRFGGAILLSVLNAGVGALSASQNSSQVYIGSSNDASSVAAAALAKDGGVPPTIRTAQGAAVNIFVARDLDFSTVGPVK